MANCSYIEIVAKVKTPQQKPLAASTGEWPPVEFPHSASIVRGRKLSRASLEHLEDKSDPAALIYTWIASHLPVEQIQAAIQLADLVFGDHSVATSWLREPNLATDNQSPISLLGTPNGFERVRNLLFRIEYGVLA